MNHLTMASNMHHVINNTNTIYEWTRVSTSWIKTRIAQKLRMCRSQVVDARGDADRVATADSISHSIDWHTAMVLLLNGPELLSEIPRVLIQLTLDLSER